MKTVCVFGITGFIGRRLEQFVAERRLAETYRFVGVDFDVSRALSTGQVSYIPGDARDSAMVASLLEREQPAYVVNLVGTFNAETFEDFFRLNVGVSQTILESVVRSQLQTEKILLVGSAAEYGAVQSNPVAEDARCEPLSYYGLTKLYQTELAAFYHRVHNLPTVVARTFNILGPGQSKNLAVGNFLAQIERAHDGDEIEVGNLDSARDYLDVGDVVEWYWKLLSHGQAGEIYNVCSGRPSVLRDVLERLIAESGKRLAVRRSPQLLKSSDVPLIYGDSSRLRALE